MRGEKAIRRKDNIVQGSERPPPPNVTLSIRTCLNNWIGNAEGSRVPAEIHEWPTGVSLLINSYKDNNGLKETALRRILLFKHKFIWNILEETMQNNRPLFIFSQNLSKHLLYLSPFAITYVSNSLTTNMNLQLV